MLLFKFNCCINVFSLLILLYHLFPLLQLQFEPYLFNQLAAMSNGHVCPLEADAIRGHHRKPSSLNIVVTSCVLLF